MPKNFIERVRYFLADRKITPWGIENGLNKGTTARMAKNEIPGHQILNLIQKIENVSINWLIHGEGRPFLISREMTDRETADYFDQLCDETGWSVYLLTDKQQPCLVMTLPAQYDYKGNRVPYTVVEVLGGDLNVLTLERFNQYKGQRYYLKIANDEMQMLRNGQMGSYLIQRLIERGEEFHGRLEMQDIIAHFSAKESSPVYESDLIQKIRALPERDQKTVSMIIDAMIRDRAG